MNLTYRDQWRNAARHVLDHTPLGSALDRLGTVDDDGTILTITARPDGSLSSGEQLLLGFLASLSGVDVGDTDLYMLLNGGVDVDCRRTVAEAVAIAAGVDELSVGCLVSPELASERRDGDECNHHHVRAFRSFPSHSKCLDCGTVVTRVWVTADRIVREQS